jgi:hypothetical protein
MPLPHSRDFTAVEGGPIRQETVNNMQDAIVAGFHGLITVRVHPLEARDAGGPATATVSATRLTLAGGNICGADWPVSIPVGTRIEAVRAWVDNNDGERNITLRLHKAPRDGSPSVVDSTSSTAAGALLEITLPAGFGEVMLEEHFYAVTTEAAADAEDATISYVELDISAG